MTVYRTPAPRFPVATCSRAHANLEVTRLRGGEGPDEATAHFVCLDCGMSGFLYADGTEFRHHPDGRLEWREPATLAVFVKWFVRWLRAIWT